MEALGYVAIFLAGLSLGLIGGGGSILMVPILVYFFGTHPVLAMGYSLLIVGTTSAIGSLSYARRHLLKIKTGLIFGFPSLIGVSVARAFLVPALPDPVFEIGAHPISKGRVLMTAFSVLMVIAAIAMLRPRKEDNPDDQTPGARKSSLALVGSLGFGVGCVTGFLGAGGGFLIVPVLALILKLPMKSAVGTSLFIIALSSLVGFAVDVLHQGSVEVGFLAMVSFLSIMGVGVGTALAHSISHRHLKKGFGFLVLAVGLVVLFEQIAREIMSFN